MKLPAMIRPRSAPVGAVTHAITWRPARKFLGETTGLWTLYTQKDYLNEHGRCDAGEDDADGGPGMPAGTLAEWAAEWAGFPVSLEEAGPQKPRPDRSDDITLRYWVRRAA